MIDRGILDGDLVIIKSARTARNGDIVALLDNEATLKEFRKSPDGRHIELIPHNRALAILKCDADILEIQGILTAVVRTNP